MTFEEASTGMASKAWLQLLARRAAEAAKVSYRARGGEVEEKRRRRRKRRPRGEVAPSSERCDASPRAVSAAEGAGGSALPDSGIIALPDSGLTWYQ